jgi:hypothetical protein
LKNRLKKGSISDAKDAFRNKNANILKNLSPKGKSAK